MVTKNKLRIYERYDGDIDSWARTGSKREKSVMTDNDWHVIERLIQNVVLMKKGLASCNFSASLSQQLKESCDTASTIDRLQHLASTAL